MEGYSSLPVSICLSVCYHLISTTARSCYIIINNDGTITTARYHMHATVYLGHDVSVSMFLKGNFCLSPFPVSSFNLAGLNAVLSAKISIKLKFTKCCQRNESPNIFLPYFPAMHVHVHIVHFVQQLPISKRMILLF